MICHDTTSRSIIRAFPYDISPPSTANRTGEDENGELFHYDPKSKTFLNIRASPVTTAECVAKAEEGAELYVLETQGDWLRVQLKDEDNPSGEMWALRRIVRGNKSGQELSAAKRNNNQLIRPDRNENGQTSIDGSFSSHEDRPGTKTDIWAFGCLLFETIAGRKLFRAGDRLSSVLRWVVIYTF